jgi:hypothetical protein
MNLELFENNWLKLASIIYSTFVTIVTTPVFLSIVSYEHNHQYRTLINQLVTNLILNSLISNAIVQVPNTMLYIFGPLPWYICYPQVFLFPTMSTSFVLLVDSISVVRYVFIFWLKNPTILQDDFWAKFFFLWTFICSFLGNLVYFILPGYGPNTLDICLGSSPLKPAADIPKTNYFSMSLFWLSIIIQIFLIVKHQMHLALGNLAENTMTRTAASKPEFVTFTFTFVIVGLFVSFSILPFFINSLNLNDLTCYPNYILMYAFYLTTVPTANILMILFMFKRDRKMVRCVIKDLKEKASSLRKNISSFNTPVVTIHN